MHRGKSTQRPAALSRQNQCSHCGQPGHTRSHGSPLNIQPSCNHSKKLPNKLHHQQWLHTSQAPVHASSTASKLEVPPPKAPIVAFSWLPLYISQSTEGGRQGSNACIINIAATG